MRPILNLTQHAATPDQTLAGVVDLPAGDFALLVKWLTFETCPGPSEVSWRAEAVAYLAAEDGRAKVAMIGGAPWLMAPLAVALAGVGIKAVFAFSRREAVETVRLDGSVLKAAVFRHAGWVKA